MNTFFDNSVTELGQESIRGIRYFSETGKGQMSLCDLLAWQGSGEGQELFYWSATIGEEVDFVIEWDGMLLPIEVKTAKIPRLADTRHLQSFRAQYKRSSLPALLVHTGNDLRWLTDGVFAVPLWMVV